MTAFYRALLRLYPASFYDRFARDMAADFDEGYGEASHHGLFRHIEFVLHGYGDLFASLVAQWRGSELYLVWRASVLIALLFWGLAFVIAALEWPRGPGTMATAVQIAIALTTCATLTIGLAVLSTRQS